MVYSFYVKRELVFSKSIEERSEMVISLRVILNFTFAFQMYINRLKVSITIFILQRSYQRQCHKRTRIGSRNSGQEITKFPQDFQVIYLQNLNISQGGDA